MRCAKYLILTVLLCSAASATAQMPSTAAVPASASLLNQADRQAIVIALARVLRDKYVFPDVGEKAAVALESQSSAGTYASLDRAAFARRLTDDLSAIAHDKHMRIVSLDEPRRGPTGSMPHGEAGIVRADRIAGGIGYIEVIGFPPLPAFKQAIDRAMTGLAGSRALIIDARRNGGGDPASVAYLVSFLTAPGRPINTIVVRTPGTHDYTRDAFASTPTPVSFAAVPVYVLTSRDTFSGGEEFAYDVQSLKRGTLIGEVTGGGANPVNMTELGHGMGALIPFGRAENAVTKTNWEGRGVQPDIAVPSSDALQVALGKAGGSQVATIEQASAERVFTPRSTPHPGSEEALRSIVAGYASGSPDYSILAPEPATEVRAALSERQAQFAALGPLQSIRFNGPGPFGGDEYRLQFLHGDVMMALVLGPHGKVAMLSTPMPIPAR